MISDHIIPYCICMDDSKENIQFLTTAEHKTKTLIDFKIFKIFKGRGWIEKVTNYSIELKIQKDKLRDEYLKEFKILNSRD